MVFAPKQLASRGCSLRTPAKLRQQYGQNAPLPSSDADSIVGTRPTAAVQWEKWSLSSRWTIGFPPEADAKKAPPSAPLRFPSPTIRHFTRLSHDFVRTKRLQPLFLQRL